jgi:hypothetical protein
MAQNIGELPGSVRDTGGAERRGAMKLYVLPAAPRASKVIALNNHLNIECDMQIVDLGRGDHVLKLNRVGGSP